ncbi:hypothetical protein A2159_01685 [Candidatus Woesebacteria bacterium RBG_13_34_9]|uniref:ABC transporter ATP-binding protein n=1 Tax=Candidatus Woesebacteria bacterium RBG_13_34_9 TaxID=1802477 RepID=A0A1F7WZU8_9BACT|nr:MAG: hypothetical protein A2159_01685 [Candidatus Woesebacteria bacterium RBG_13_34_9]
MKNILKILKYTRVYWNWYLFMAFFVCAVSLLSLVTPFLLKQVVDTLVANFTGSESNISRVWFFLILIILSDVAITCLTTFSQWIGDVITVRLQSHLSKKFYEKLLILDISFYDKEQTGAIVNKLNRGIESVTDFIQDMFNNFLPFFLTAIITVMVLARYSKFISLLLAILFPLYILISHKSTMMHFKYERQKNAILDPTQGRMLESIVGIRIVRVFLGEIFELSRFSKARNRIESITRSQSKVWHIYDFWRRLLLNVILFGILSYIVLLTFKKQYTLGEMTLLMQLVQQARFPLFAMSFILGQIQRADAGSKDFFDILETPVKILNINKASRLVPRYRTSKRIIEFQNVKFSYEEKKQVLNNISFFIDKGEKLALVGESGQGKSTLVNLVLRYYQPQRGMVKIFGKDVSKVTKESLFKNITVVFQESLLFSGTVYENIKYGKPNATKQEVVAAAKAANAHEFIINFPRKYESFIGERGIKLSGGQKQRIAIARAILKDAPIIILDEATSSLDSRSEILVQQGLERLMKGRTSIIIAHRLSTITDADKILVISGGRIAQFGSPKILLKQENGLYSKMIKLQQKLMTASKEEREKALKEFDLVA